MARKHTYKVSRKNRLRTIAINISVFMFFTAAIEVFLGNWLKPKPPISSIPNARWGQRTVYDATKLTGEPNVVNTVDAKGYRGYTDFSKDNIVLTVGGSTTEQLFIGDGKTWQERLNKLFENKYQFVNGGIGGQSTFGHIYAVSNWHSKELRPEQVKAVVIYFGINDIGPLLVNGQANPNESRKPSAYQFRRDLAGNSFFFQRIRALKNIAIALLNNSKDRSAIWAGHTRRIHSFVDGRKPEPISRMNAKKYAYYKSLISSLIAKTSDSFPSAKIIFVQQQIPGCMFLDQFNVVDRHPQSSAETKDGCRELGEVYLAQDSIIKSLDKLKRPLILKMYLTRAISDSSVYDYTHTNSQGSREIARYLKDNLPL